MVSRFSLLFLFLFVFTSMFATNTFVITGPAYAAESKGIFSIFKSKPIKGFNVVMAGYLFEQPGNSFYIKTFKDEDIRVEGKKIKKLRRYCEKHVFIKGFIENANTKNEYLKIKKIKKLKAEEIDALERMYRIVDQDAHRNDQKPSALVSKSDGIYNVTNVRWDNEPEKDGRPAFSVFKNTKIDTSKIKRVLFILEPFPPESIAAHSMLFFEVEKGGVTCVDKSGKTLESTGLVFSMEAFMEKGVSYDLKKGLGKNFRNVMQLCTLENRLSFTLDQRRHKLRPFDLKLSQSQRVELFKSAVDFACLDHNAEFYNTYVKNCTNTLIQLINLVVEPDRKIREWIIPRVFYNPRATVPVLVPSYLKKKGLIKAELPVMLPDDYEKILKWYFKPVR